MTLVAPTQFTQPLIFYRHKAPTGPCSLPRDHYGYQSNIFSSYVKNPYIKC